MADPARSRRIKIAQLIHTLRHIWKDNGERGKWARFRMGWLMDKRLGLHPSPKGYTRWPN